MKNKFILKNSFDSIVMRHNLMRNEDKETIEQCVNVANNFAIEFLEWYGGLRLDEVEGKTTKQLLEIFKKNNYYDTRRKKIE